MTVRPADLNKTIAWLFIIGSALFALGSVPAYLNAVGATADSVTYFVGSIFFTAASFAQLLQAQTPAMTEVDANSQLQRAPVRFWAPRRMIAIGLQPLHSFPARCSSTSAPWQPSRTMQRHTSRTGGSGGQTFTDRRCSSWPASSLFSRWGASQLPTAFLPMVDCLAEHDRIDLLHGFRHRQLCSRQLRRVDQQSRLGRRHLIGCGLLPARSGLDVPQRGAVRFELRRNH